MVLWFGWWDSSLEDIMVIMFEILVATWSLGQAQTYKRTQLQTSCCCAFVLRKEKGIWCAILCWTGQGMPQGSDCHLSWCDDLLNPQTLALFKNAVREHRIHALIAGPPCETWSKARNANDGGPRPLRSIEQPWSLTHLRMREFRQTQIGNALLGSAVTLFVEALLATALMLLEHPAAPDEVDKPSIWKLDLIWFLTMFPNCQKVTLSQGYFGAKSPKPTTFLIANGLADANSFFAAKRTRATLPAFRSIGKDKEGKWHTSSLKECPPDLCCTIVDYMEATLSTQIGLPLIEQPAEFLSSLSNLVQTFDFGAPMGPDFAG